MKKTIPILCVLFLFTQVAYAANLLDRAEDTAPTSDDMMYCVNDPGGTPTDKKCTIGNITKGMHTALDARYVARSDWTTHDNYPTACAAGEYVNDIDDTLTCVDATTEIDSSISTHAAINNSHHNPVTVTDTSIIDMTLATQDIQATVVADSLDFTEFADTMTLDVSTTIGTGSNTLTLQCNNPGSGCFDFNGTGAFTGDLVHIHQHTGNPVAGNLIHAEAVDIDINPLVHITQDAADITGNVVMLLIDAVDNDDVNYIPLEIRDDADTNNDLLMSIDYQGTILSNSLTASEVLITNASKEIVSAAVATYPSLAELAYVKGVTSAIQTQIDTKGAGDFLADGTVPMTGALQTSHGSILADATVSGILTLGGTGGSKNENVLLDFEKTANAIVVRSTSGADNFTFEDMGFRIGDSAQFIFGLDFDASFLWATTGNDNFQIQLDTGSVTDSGYLNIIERSDNGNANRSPDADWVNGATPADSTFCVTSSDATDKLDHGCQWHDQTNYNIAVGSGDLKLDVTDGNEIILDGIPIKSISAVDTDGINNIFMGVGAGDANTTGDSNVFIGSTAGDLNTEGSFNVFIGQAAGTANTTGDANFFMGDAAGEASVTADANVYIGQSAGRNNLLSNNVMIGKQAGWVATGSADNVLIGTSAGFDMTTGDRNVLIGLSAGVNQTDATGNVFIGWFAGQNETTGTGNIGIGYQASTFNKTGINNTKIGYQSGYGVSNNNHSNNTFVGYLSGKFVSTGGTNTFIGSQAGEDISTGDGNVAIGYMAGEGWLDTESNLLVIDNSDTTTPLIYGDFSTNDIIINGTLRPAPPSAQTITAGDTITDDGCGGIKQITSAGSVTTSTTNTFTAPASTNTGCCMDVVNTGANNITLDNNANFKSIGGANIVMTADDATRVCSNGTNWYSTGSLVAN